MSHRRGIGDLVTGLPKARAALAFASRLHAGQLRNTDGAPFILHPIEVGMLLYRSGAPDHVIAAGLLHDVIEKGGVNADQLRRRFGMRVTRIVVALTEDGAISGYHARKTALRRQVAAAGDEALTVFAADKVSKVRELRSAARPFALRGESGASRTRAREVNHYRNCLELLEELLPESPLVTKLHSELKRLGVLEPHPRALAGAA